MSILSELTNTFPSWKIILFVFLFFMFIFIGGIIAFVILSRLRWPFTVNVLQDIDGSGKLKIVSKDKARLISFGDGGEEIFLLKKSKKYRVAYGKRIGNKAIAWAVADDGYWYNITFQDINKKLMEVGVMPIERDMRLATASIRKGIDHRYDDKNWMDKYGAVLYFGLFLITLLVFAVVVLLLELPLLSSS